MSKKADKHSPNLNRQSAEVKKLRRRLKEAEESTANWKAKAKLFEAEAKKSDAKAKRSAAKAAKWHKKVEKVREDRPSRSTAPDASLGSATPPTASAVPDESWTVSRLRASARDAAVPRYSRMTKAALLEALTPPHGQ
jgi:peptidoglycan hydrolase CwlO-like protein